MNKECCIVHANCQGEPLAAALGLHPEFAARYEVEVHLNYTRQRVPAERLAACSLFLYQHLGPEWGELASERLTAALPPSARTLAVPNMFCLAYWPLWSGAPGFDFRDVLLDDLLERGLSKAEILFLYLKGDLIANYAPDARVETSLAHERRKEAHTPVKYVDYMLAHLREEQLFNTVNHPGPRLLRHAARGVLRELGLEPPDFGPDDIPGLHPEFRLPIHPRVATRLGLDFAGKGATYPVYGREKTFAQYAENYVDCRLLGVDDFLGYLQLR